jgi:hypothetical protein
MLQEFENFRPQRRSEGEGRKEGTGRGKTGTGQDN